MLITWWRVFFRSCLLQSLARFCEDAFGMFSLAYSCIWPHIMRYTYFLQLASLHDASGNQLSKANVATRLYTFAVILGDILECKKQTEASKEGFANVKALYANLQQRLENTFTFTDKQSVRLFLALGLSSFLTIIPRKIFASLPKIWSLMLNRLPSRQWIMMSGCVTLFGILLWISPMSTDCIWLETRKGEQCWHALDNVYGVATRETALGSLICRICSSVRNSFRIDVGSSSMFVPIPYVLIPQSSQLYQSLYERRVIVVRLLPLLTTWPTGTSAAELVKALISSTPCKWQSWYVLQMLYCIYCEVAFW